MSGFVTLTNPWAVLALSYLLPLSPLAVVGLCVWRRNER